MSHFPWRPILRWGSVIASAISWVLLIAAIATDTWAGDFVRTASFSPLGDISVKLDVGIFQILSEECCFVAGQLVYDFQTICAINTPGTGCQSAKTSSSEFCQVRYVQRAIGSRCRDLENASIAAAIVAIASVILTTIGGLIAVWGQYWAIAGLCMVLSTVLMLVEIVIVPVFVVATVRNYFQVRYNDQSANSMQSSLALCIAAFVFGVVAAVLSFVMYWLAGRLVKPPPQRPPPVVVSHLMTPQYAINPVSTHFSSPAQPSEMCPLDLDCPFTGDLQHHLQYVHTCRQPFCTDSSAAHCTHYVHS